MMRASSFNSYITMTRTTCFVIFALLILQAVDASPARLRRQNSGFDWNQVNPGPESTTTQSPASGSGTTTTTASPQYIACINSCGTTPEYNPVCASNRVTYDNESKMRCANRCGLSVRKLFGGTCSPL